MQSTAATPFNSRNTVSQAPTQQNGFHIYDAIDGNKMIKSSKQTSSPSKLQPKEPLQRRSSAPDQTGQQSKSKDNTQVVHSKLSSFQVLSVSSSSHRIIHTSEDGGVTRRRQSLRVGYEANALADPQTQPSRLNHFSQASLGPKNSSRNTEGSSNPNHNEAPDISTANTSGVYDSLSPPISPVDPLQNSPLNKQLTKQQEGVLKPSEIQSLSGAYDRLSPVDLAAIRQESEKLAQQEMAQSRSNPARQQSVSRQASNASSSSEASQSQQEERDNTASRHSYAEPSHKHRQLLTSSKSQKNTSGTSYIPVTSPENDTSTAAKGVKRHMRSNSSEDRSLNKVSTTFSSTSAIPQRPTRRSSDPYEQRNLYSPSSSSTNTLSSPEPSSDCLTPDSDERRARLDMHWSRQSLDRNVNAVAVSTVQALSTLIEVITPVPSPMKTGHHFKYEAPPPVNPNWYADDDSDSSSFPLSPLSLDIPTTSPSETTTSPPVQSPLTASVGVSMLPTVSQPRRLSDTTKDIRMVQDKAVNAKKPTEAEPASIVSSRDTSASGTHQECSKLEETVTNNKISSTTEAQSDAKHTSKLESIQKDKSSNETVHKAKSVTFFGQKDEKEHNKSQERDSPKTSEKTNASSTTKVSQNPQISESNAAKENGPRLSQARSVTHDYAIIDPLDHDYAILDPEYHDEFFGK